MSVRFVHAPMVNVNEDQAALIEWFKSEGDFIHKSEVLCALETTKSTYDLTAESEGYFIPLVSPGDTVNTGQIIAVLTTEKDEKFTLPSDSQVSIQDTVPTDQAAISHRWTKKAEIIAKRNNINEKNLESYYTNEQVITEQMVNAYITEQKEQPRQTGQIEIRSKYLNHNQRVLIIGGGNVAVLVMDILTCVPHQTAMGIVDDNPSVHGSSVMGCKVLGNLDQVLDLWHQNAFDQAALAIGTLPARADIYRRFTAQGIPFTNIIDPSVVIGSEASMGNGNMIMAFCRLGPECMIGDNNFLSAYVNIEHHNVMGSHCTFGPNVSMSGGVHIGDQVRFGTGVSVEPRLTIGDHAVIASGVILTTNVPAYTTVRNKTNFTFHQMSK